MRRYTPTIVVVAALLSAACSPASDPPAPAGPKTTTIAIPYGDLLNHHNVTRDVALAVGDTLQISLGTNTSTGYRWNPDLQISDTAVLVQAGHEVITPAGSPPGAPGSEVWALQALGRGAAIVRGSYGRPWAGGEKDAWTFTAQVTVN